MSKPNKAIKEWKAGLLKRGLSLPDEEVLVRCTVFASSVAPIHPFLFIGVTLSESLEWDLDTFANKYEAFILGLSGSAINNENEDINVISSQRLTEFMTKERNQLTTMSKLTQSIKSNPYQNIKLYECIVLNSIVF